MRLKALKKPRTAKRLSVGILDITNDRIIATWSVLPDVVLSCPVLRVCGETCTRCFK